ncbi:Flp pilus assembly protein CpaB [Arthrobacter sp. TMN-50]
MKSRLIGGAIAVVLVLVGAVLVFSYTQGANERAMAGLDPVGVLIVQEAVPAGTPVEDLAAFVSNEPQPSGAVPASALQDLEGSAGTVTAVDLVPGEQLLAERLVDPAELETPGTVPVPDGLQEVTFALEPQRVVGGKIVAGDTVGLFVSFEGVLEEGPGQAVTQQVFHKVLITGFQRAEASAEQPVNTEALPTGTMLVTAAVNDIDATKIIFGAEFGRIWLTKEPDEATESEPTPITFDEVYP